ncbi:MAG TPA: hypothetical protein ENH53_03380 [Bacteroidetes bacterium]|nr:hypothetical protein [Bacteroidota bacterium]
MPQAEGGFPDNFIINKEYGSSRECVLFKRLAAIIPDQNEMRYLLPEMRGIKLKSKNPNVK